MAITSRDDLLFCWDQRVKPGVLPIIGGDPVFDRDSARTFIGADEKLRSAIVDTPVIEFEDITGDGKRDNPVTPLQLARTNKLGFSRDYSQWTNYDSTDTGAQSDPAGGSEAYLIEATVNYGAVYRNTNALTGDGVKSVGVIIKPGSAPNSRLLLYDTTAAAYRHEVNVAWSAAGAAPTVTTQAGAGTIFPPVRLADGWWWIRFTVSGVVAANTNTVYIYPAAASTGTAYVFDAQVEDAAFPTLPIHTPTSAAAARAVETLNWQNPPAYQALVGFASFVNGVPSGSWSQRVFHIAPDNSTNPRLTLYRAADALRLLLNNGTASADANAALTAAAGDYIEACFILRSTGSTALIVRKNGGSIVYGTAGAPSGGLPSAHAAGAVTWLNSVSTGAIGHDKYERLIMAKAASVSAATDGTANQALMDELAAVITDTNGNPI